MKTVVTIAAAALMASAGAKEVARVGDERGQIILFNDAANCTEGDKFALYQDRMMQVKGCWFQRQGRVWMYFDDGDNWAVPREVFFKEV